MLLAFRQSVAESTGVDVSQVEVTGIHTDGDNTPGEPPAHAAAKHKLRRR